MKQTNSLIDGALSAAIFAVLLLITIYMPIIGSITTFFLPLPMIYYATKHGLKPSLITLLVYVALSIIIGGPIISMTALFFTIPGMVIGYLYNRESSAFAVIVGGSLAYISLLILIYIGAIVILHVDLLHLMTKTINESITTAKKITASLNTQQTFDWSTLENQIKLFKYFVPTLLVTTGIMTTFITLLFSRPVLKRLGIKLPKWTPFREWRFPRSLVWYYLIAFVGIAFFNLKEGTALFSIFYNVFALLEIVMIVQGYAFIFFYAHYKKLNKSIPIIIVVVSFLIPQVVMFIIRLLGIIDLGFDLRKRFK